jgi:hypothetical protein
MEISKSSTRTFNSRTGIKRHGMVRLADGRAATDCYRLHDGPDFVGNGRSITERPLTADEWAAIERGETIEVTDRFSTAEVEIA